MPVDIDDNYDMTLMMILLTSMMIMMTLMMIRGNNGAGAFDASPFITPLKT